MTQQRPNESDEDYEKRKRRVKLTMMGALANGGGSIIAAAAIYYQDNGGNFLYIPDGSGNLVLDNKGSLGPTYDGLLYSGRGIELGATNDVDIPIHHTLGAELTTNIDTALTAGTGTFIYTKNSNSAFDLAITVVGTDVNNPRQDNSMVITNGETYKIYMDVSITSGTPLIRKIDGVIINRTLTSGTNIIEFTATADKSALFIVWDELSLYDISVTNYSVKQITNPNSYLTYYDFTNGFEYIDCSLLTPSTTYTVNSKTVNNVLTHTTAWNATDKSKIENNPNLVGKLAVETLGATKTIAELDMELDQGASADKWFMCAEPTLATLYNARSTDSITIANYAETVRTNADLQQKGIQTTAFVTDGAGVPTSYSSNLLQFNGDGRYVDTGWIPSGTEPFTIEYVWELENSAIDARIGTFNVGFRNTLGVVYYQAGASSINGGSVSSGLYHLVASFDGVNVTFYVNNVSKGSVAGNTSAIKTFTLGARNATALDFPSYNPSGTFKVHKNKALTATEVATAYAKAKAIYPTLP